jgi:hypothetical protein
VALLRSAARLSVSEDKDGIVVRVANVGAGHRLPTGASDFRQMWLDVTVTDVAGKVVLSSGKLDAGGNLDPDARVFVKVLGDKDAHAVGLEFWRFGRMNADTRIPADGHRDERFGLPPDARYPLEVDVRLMFRTFPQWITDRVRERFPTMPSPSPVEMADLSKTLPRPMAQP